MPNPYKYKYEWMQENASHVEVLVMGSSHTFYGVRPEFLDGKAFSLANVSQDLRHDYFLLNYWADKYKKLKTVIVPISAFTFFGQGLEYGSESYRCRYYKIYMDCDLYPDFSIYNLELSDFRTFKGKLGSWFYDKFIETLPPGQDEYGWSNAYVLSNKDMEQWNDGTEAAAAVKRHTAKTWEYIGQNYALLKEIATFCKERHIQMVLMTTPCWHSYYEHLDQQQLSKMHELIRAIQQEYNVPYFDYLKDARFVADDFQDSNHLSDVGAAKFTKILNADIRSHCSHCLP